MSITALITWLTLALNPSLTATQPDCDPARGDASQPSCSSARESADSRREEPEGASDEAEEEAIKPFSQAFFISNGF